MIRNAFPVATALQHVHHPHACTEAEANFLEVAFPVAGRLSLNHITSLGTVTREAAQAQEDAWHALDRERGVKRPIPPYKRPIPPHEQPLTEHIGVTRAHAGKMPGPFVSVDLATVADGDTVDLPGRKVTFRVERKLRPVTAPIFLPRDLADRVRRMATGLVTDGSFEDDGGVRVTLKIEAREGWTA